VKKFTVQSTNTFKMKKLNLIICFLACLSTGAFSQYIKMGVSSVKADNAEQQQQMEGTLKSMKMETFANEEQIRTDMNMMGGMVMISTFTNPKDDVFTMYVDMMGSKSKVIPTAAELASIKDENAKKGADVKVVEVPGDTKTILGFNCKKYTVTTADDMKFSMYVAPELKIKANNIQGMEGVKLDGYPLEYTIEAMGTKMTFTAEKFEKTFDAKKLTPPTGEYKEVNFTDFKKQMPGM